MNPIPPDKPLIPTTSPRLSRREMIVATVAGGGALAVPIIHGLHNNLSSISLTSTLEKLPATHKAGLLSTDNSTFTPSVYNLIRQLAKETPLFKRGLEMIQKNDLKYQASTKLGDSVFGRDNDTNSMRINMEKVLAKGNEADKLRKLVATIAASMALLILDKPELKNTYTIDNGLLFDEAQASNPDRQKFLEVMVHDLATQTVVGMVLAKVNGNAANESVAEAHCYYANEVKFVVPGYCDQVCSARLDAYGNVPLEFRQKLTNNVTEKVYEYLHELQMDQRSMGTRAAF